MDVMELLKGAPGLLDAVKGAGVPDDKLPGLGEAIGSQLGGDGFDLTDLLGGLDLDGFLSRLDVNALAEQVGITPDTAQKVVELIGPAIADYVPGGDLGKLVGRFFD